MNVVKISELVNSNFNCVFLNSLKQFWYTTKTFQCINAPKKENLFLLLVGCKIRFTHKNGRITEGKSGDLLYIPMGSEYRVELFDFESEKSHTIGINFLLKDECFNDLILSNNVEVLASSLLLPFESLFIKSLKASSHTSVLDNRLVIFEILSLLATDIKTKTYPSYIVDAINYPNENLDEVISVKELSKRALVSEVYFRKQFKKCTQTSPIEYRNELRLIKAKSYLEHGEISIQEISDTLGYATVSHFIKEFKKRYGYSPLKFRKISLSNK
ncbi:MAG: helix-turn-helix transcriptional regulator [Clostridia bacterium]|nr:helix-turn-helix transcriptional regulator [Clostridia bacterium]